MEVIIIRTSEQPGRKSQPKKLEGFVCPATRRGREKTNVRTCTERSADFLAYPPRMGIHASLELASCCWRVMIPWSAL